jgi:hypothetical protein
MKLLLTQDSVIGIISNIILKKYFLLSDSKKNLNVETRKITIQQKCLKKNWKVFESI